MPGAIINPSTASGGINNLVTVADIVARNLEPHDQDILVKVLDASDDATVEAGWALYQWNISLDDWQKIAEEESSDIVPASESAAGVVRMATDIEAAAGASGVAITPAQAIARIQALGVEFVGGSSYSPADPDELESDYPAASYVGKWGIISSGSALDGMYKSNGSIWLKRFDDSGDRTTLWDYSAGVTYGASNLMTASGTAYARNDADSADTTIMSGTAATPFDGLNNNALRVSAAYFPFISYKIYDVLPDALGKFEVQMYGSGVDGGATLQSFEIIGKTSDGDIETLLPVSVSTTNGAHTASLVAGSNGDSKISLSTIAISGEKITINTSNMTRYVGYGVRVFTAGGSTYFSEILGYKSISATDAIDCVRSINKLNTRIETLEAAGVPASSTVADSTALSSVTGQAEGDRLEVTNYAGTGITEVVEWNGSAWIVVTDEVTANKALALAQSVVGSAGAVELYVANAATGAGSGVDASNYMSWATFAATYGGSSSSYNNFNTTSKIFIHFPSNETITTSATYKYFNNLDIVLIPTNNLTFQTNYLYFNSCKIRAVSSSYTITTPGIFFKGCKIDLASYHLTSTGTIDFYECDTVICNNLTAVNINVYTSKVVCYDLSASSNLACFYLAELLCYNGLVCGAGQADEFARIKTITINSTSSFVLTTGSTIVYNTNSGTAPTTGDASAFVYDV